MPSCSIKLCGSRKSKNHPTLTLHKFPTNEVMRKKWIELIGIENINTQHKMWFVCSLHFNDTCFNKTLNVARLKDGAVPLSYLMPGHCYSKNISGSPTTSTISSALIDSQIRQAKLSEKQNILTSQENVNENVFSVEEIQQLQIRILSQECNMLKKKVNSLNQKVRRRDRKIARFADTIQDLQ